MKKTLKILNQPGKTKDLQTLARKLFREKKRRHKELARLPFERKIEILVELQKIASGVARRRGKRASWVWEIPPS